MRTLALIVLGVSVFAAASCAPATRSKAAPECVWKVGSQGTAIFYAAKDSQWGQAARDLQSLKACTQQLQTEVKGNDDKKKKLEQDAGDIERALSTQNREQAMLSANDITLVATNIAGEYQVSMPMDVPRLDYYARQLQIYAEANDTGKLKATADQMKSTWQQVFVNLQSHVGPDDTKKMQIIIDRLQAAKQPSEYQAAASDVVGVVSDIERLYGHVYGKSAS